MRVLVFGAGGQLASALLATVPPGIEASAVAEAELDIRDRAAVEAKVRATRPGAIVNAAAYTAVDQAESDADRCFAVNRDGAGNIAAAAAEFGAFLVHISTDFVFDGRSGTPYRTGDAPNPLSVYGRSKLEGELLVRTHCRDSAVIRTAWLYAPSGKNFVRTMLHLMATKPSLRVVADQIGSPTHARGLARACWAAIERRAAGYWHWTDAGVASWYDFAVAIAELGKALGVLERSIPIEPIRTEDYPTPARRPAYSVLDKTTTWAALGLAGEHWRGPLRATIEEIAHGSRI